MTEWQSMHLSLSQRQEIEAAITKAEKKTSAEIFAVFANRSDDYRFFAYSILAAWILIISAILVLFLEVLPHGIANNWGTRSVPVSTLVWAQILAFLAGILLFRFSPGLAGLMVPQKISHERAHNNAVKQFLAHNIHNTDHRTGVLVFVSLQERFGEILVDRAIEEKIGREYFLELIEVMINSCDEGKIAEAFQETIKTLGEKLSEGFPRTGTDKNQLADKLIVL